MASETVAGPAGGRKALPHKAVTLIIVVLLVIVVVATPFIFLESRAFNINELKDVPMVPGAESITLNVMASVGELEVYFAPLDGKAAEVIAEVEGKASYFGNDEPLNLTLEHYYDAASKRMTVDVGFNAYAPWPYYSLDRTQFTVVVNSSLRTALDLKVTTGGINVTTVPGVVLEGLSLNATSEGTVVALNNGTVLAGNVHIHTATGGTQFRWYNVSVQNYPVVVLSESSGIINVTIQQHQPLNGSVEVKAVDVMGGIKFKLDLSGINSAEINSKRGDFINNGGFIDSEPPSPFRSNNYDDPDTHRFNVQLNNIIGGIMVDGRWTES